MKKEQHKNPAQIQFSRRRNQNALLEDTKAQSILKVNDSEKINMYEENKCVQYLKGLSKDENFLI